MIARVIDILSWLDADPQAPAARVLREQAVIDQVTPRDPCKRVLAWWELMSARTESGQSPGEQWEHRYHRLVLVLASAGAMTGSSAMAGAAVIDREQPINLLLMAAVFLVLPTISWLLSVAAILWRARSRGIRHDGLFGADGIANRWLERSSGFRSLTRKWPANTASALIESHLQMLPQWFTVGFFTGALLALFALVMFTDLAFGWSTTIEMAAGSVASVCRWLAWPWSGWLPVAVPDMTLVEASRFFRLEDRDLDRVAAASLGQWWPFVTMCILVWGLLPRVVLMAGLHLRKWLMCRQMLLAHPQVQALLERLQRSGIAVTASANGDGEGRSLSQGERSAVWSSGDEHMTLVWNDCLSATTSGDLPLANFRDLRVDVQQTDAQWEALARTLDDAGSTTLELLVAGWEPPSLSLRDFLQVLNRGVRHSLDIRIVPINMAGTGIDAIDQKVWELTLAGWAMENVTVADRWSRP
jgi:Protein of unknown function (DUF2868)